MSLCVFVLPWPCCVVCHIACFVVPNCMNCHGLAAIIISVIYHHYLILVSGEVLYESVNADTGRHVLLCLVSE